MKLRKLFTAFLLSLTVLCSGTVVYADIILDPSGNRFFDSNYNNCRIEGDYRKYTALKSTYLYKSPVRRDNKQDVSEGDILVTNAYYTDKKGVVWGYNYGSHSDKDSGWFKLDDTELIYDSISFVEEHESELSEYSGQLGDLDFEENVYIWKYPHSGELTLALPPEEWLPEAYGTRQEQLEGDTPYVYIDSAGDEWVYVRARPNGWVYVPDPTLDLRTEGIVSEGAETTVSENIEAYGDVTDISKVYPTAPYEKTELALPLVLAASVAVLSGGLIRATKKRGK
ncbi:MAG: hypothetical protein K2N72_07595 [Oscillospiraceae bacterium]|nr:hypothetical protein [Oscillospiraceae bacterium]